MQSSKEFLEICYSLGLKGHFGKLRGDRRVARGFADLGYEEFLLLQEKKLISLYTGTPSELPAAHKAFFFNVPTQEDLIDEMLAAGFEVASLQFVNQRTWRLELRKSGGEILPSVEHKELETVLAKAFLQAVTLQPITLQAITLKASA